MSTLEQRLEEIARVPILLVASDYDGTVAPIVSDPSQAAPHREALVALRMLAATPLTHVAVISGRALGDLATLLGTPEDVHLVGSHGSEFDVDFATSLSRESAALRTRIEEELREVVARHAGLTIETKPAGVALHYRNTDPTLAETAVEEVLGGAAAIEGVVTRHGKKVLELSVVSTHKGTALETIRHRVGASAVIFFGDDVTDEDAFKTLAGPDIGVKIGEGESRAPFRLDGPADVAHVLARLSELRADWLEGGSAVPIEQHSMLSDLRTVALVTPEARISWMCMPRIDSPALFADLLGGPAAGHFSIRPVNDDAPATQRYLDDSMALETKWTGVSVVDFMDCSGHRTEQRAGRSELIRILDGRGSVEVEFAPRLNFGRVPTRLRPHANGIVVEETHDPIVLRSPGVNWSIEREGENDTARATIELTGEPVVLELRYGTGSLNESFPDVEHRQVLTGQFWSSWTSQLRLPVIEPDLVRRCAITLKALCHGPTGAIAAAGTTSLPEHIGGVRNWDYRFCWPRDAALSASALVKLGATNEAMEFLDWVLGVLERCESPERLRPLYCVSGSEVPAEAEITDLSGYRGSRPVRVGNAAGWQVQLDVFGPIVQLVLDLLDAHAPLSSEHWRLVEQMVRAVEQRWHEPDHGIWEIRRERRHHVYSKVMCWLTVDRAIAVANRFLERDHEDWHALRSAIAADVLEHGYKQEINAFTAAYDGTDTDAASLHVGLSGLLAADDPRFIGTVEAVERSLRKGPTVYRYRSDDGLPGFEGGFHICAAWLVESYLAIGRVDDARALFDDIVRLAGPTGTLSEQFGPNTKRALGNVPQAYSHLAVIENAIKLAK